MLHYEVNNILKWSICAVLPLAPKGGRTSVLTPSVLSLLDRINISDCHAGQIIAKIVQVSNKKLIIHNYSDIY